MGKVLSLNAYAPFYAIPSFRLTYKSLQHHIPSSRDIVIKLRNKMI
uniref:Uncharacterized protein n=1 Tax=Rhizophora mucronata TaxID=61149 RepID=A0A2P2JJF7_RHIMU